MTGSDFDLGELAQRLGNKRAIALLLDRLSRIAYWAGRHPQAITWSEESIALHREIANELGLSEALHHRGDLAAALTDQESADRYYAESRQLQAQLSAS